MQHIQRTQSEFWVQVRDYGYIPAALPDANCFGDTASISSASSSIQQVPVSFVNQFTDFARAATSGQTDVLSNAPNVLASAQRLSSSNQASEAFDQEDGGKQAAPSFSELAAQSTEAAKRGAGDFLTSIRATYNSVAQTISELDFTPLGKQANFVKCALQLVFSCHTLTHCVALLHMHTSVRFWLLCSSIAIVAFVLCRVHPECPQW